MAKILEKKDFEMYRTLLYPTSQFISSVDGQVTKTGEDDC